MAENNDKVVESRRHFLQRGKMLATAAVAVGASGAAFTKGRLDGALDLLESPPDVGRRAQKQIESVAQEVRDQNEQMFEGSIALTAAGGAGMVTAIKREAAATVESKEMKPAISRRNVLKYAPAAAGAALAFGGMEKALYGVGDYTGVAESLIPVTISDDDERKAVHAKMRSVDKRAAEHIKDGSLMIMGAGVAMATSSAFVLREAAKRNSTDKDEQQR